MGITVASFKIYKISFRIKEIIELFRLYRLTWDCKLFGWLKKRQENELIKLFYQNSKAFHYFTLEQEAAEEEGLQVTTKFSEKAEICNQLSIKFSETKSLSVDEQKLALDLNREARDIYELLRKERNEISKVFGSKLELVPKFDDNFKPLLGWDDYITEWKSQD